MKKVLSIGIIFLSVMIFGGCMDQVKITGQKLETGLNNGSVKVDREDEGPSQGGALNLFMLKPDTLNPLTTQNLTVRQLSFFVFDSLFYEGEDGTPENGLVESFIFGQDDLILDIELRDNIAFHDGQALTSDDVAFSVETILSAGEKSLYLGHVANIQSVKVFDRLSLRIILKKPDARILEKLTFPIVPKHVFQEWPIEGHGDNLKLIGTGPFIFDSYKDNDITLSRNEFWWNQQVSGGLSHPIWLDAIAFKVYLDESEMMEAFQKQEIDVAFLVEGEIEGYAQRSDIFFSQYESNILEFLIFSTKKDSPIAQEGFRTTLLKYLSWYATLNPINRGEPAFESLPDFSFPGNRMDRESTLAALEVVGFSYQEDKNILFFYKNRAKIPVSLSLKYNAQNGDRQAVSEWITTALYEIGIKVTAEPESYSKQQDFVESGKFEMMLLGCQMPLFTDIAETLGLVRESLGLTGHNAAIFPLYRKYGAVLYHDYIRGPRTPIWKNIYKGWSEWYLVNGSE